MEQATETKRKRRMINYVGLRKLYLETADYRLFAHPYGPRYNEAVGRIFQEAWVSGPDLSETKEAHVKKIVSDIPISQSEIGGVVIGEVVPISVFRQLQHKDGVVLLAKIEYGQYEKMSDTKNRGGNWLILILYSESASRITFGDQE